MMIWAKEVLAASLSIILSILNTIVSSARIQPCHPATLEPHLGTAKLKLKLEVGHDPV
jgi:hypothetical protein